ncbi:MAG: energy transducer TonB [Acidobacteria bacterium]|nr:energy transducer TonB [Acidobacteriota bacterium]
MFSYQTSHRILFFFVLAFLFAAAPAWAQEEDLKPTYVTARLFVVRTQRNQEPLTNQLFRLRTAAQTDDEKWLSNMQKAYPAASGVALLRTQQLRLFMIPKPGILMVGDPMRPHLEFQFLIAQGLRDDDSINTTAIIDANFYGGPKAAHPVPMSMANNGFEIAPGMSYFFTTDGLRLKHDVYTVYFRDRSFAPILEQYDHYLVLSLTVDADKPSAWSFDATKSAELQSKASKKVEPVWSDEVKNNKFFGKVQVRVEIGADGKVANANIWESSLPEGNLQALAAARQWEFPTTELAGINSPASALLTFAIAPPPPPKAPEKAAPTDKTPATEKSQGQAKPAEKKTTATKPPVKRRNK